MHWFNVISAVPIWLSWPEPGGAFQLRQQGDLPNTREGFVYRGDARDPRAVRNFGGFRPQGLNWEHDEEAFSIDHHHNAGPNGCEMDGFGQPDFSFRTAYVSATREMDTASGYGIWIYEIRATPNILDIQWPEPYPDGEVFALGGIHWRQVRRFARIRRPDARPPVDDGDWMDNPDYDVRLYEESAYAAMCRVSVDFPNALSWGEVGDEQSSWPQRPMFHTAQNYVNEVAFDVVGSFPLDFLQYPLDEDIPGSSRPDQSEHHSMQNQVAHELQQFIHMSDAELDGFFPEGRGLVGDLMENGHLNPGACAALLRPRETMDKRAEDHEQPRSDSCCRMVAALRKKWRRNQLVRRVFGLSLDEMQRLIEGRFDDLNCALLIARMQEKEEPDGGRDSGGIYIVDAPTAESTERDCRRAQDMVTPQPTTAIFHADSLWPAEAKHQGGFLPHGNSKSFAAWRTFGGAARKAGSFDDRRKQGIAGVVYLVRATPNILVEKMTTPVVVGGITWKQVMGWTYVPRNYTPPKDRSMQDAQPRARFLELLERLSEQNTTLFEHNVDYDHSLNNKTANRKYVNLDDQPVEVFKAFMDVNGGPVGWKGDFPLFSPPPERRLVPAEHEPGVLERMYDFLVGPSGAMLTLLTATVAALLIPGVVEALGVDEVLDMAFHGGAVGLLQMLRVTLA
ncbi:putative enterotoxin [Ophiocordyceps unilateralis]|uniref:Enterotoxin n=1 Tax=Ophiocordyceps unilateralis TaxID=268505 RepID=A0A2A9PI10_OPHUN|nr:putative enterotoxin [Ophiocordyceps unilateralis]